MTKKKIEPINTLYKRKPTGELLAPNDAILELANKVNEIIAHINEEKEISEPDLTQSQLGASNDVSEHIKKMGVYLSQKDKRKKHNESKNDS